MKRGVPKSLNRDQATSNEGPMTLLTPLDDSLEWQAHAFMLERLGLYNAAIDVLRTYKDVSTMLQLAKKQASSGVHETL